MKLYWQEGRTGQRLMFSLDDGEETNVGTVRKTRQGFDALAVTTGYDPGRAQKGFATLEEAKAFVEEFHPWDMFGGDFDLVVDPEVRPNPAVPDTGSSGSSERDAEAADPIVAEAAAPPPVVAEAAAAPKPPTEEPGPAAEVPYHTNADATSTRKPWWRFW